MNLQVDIQPNRGRMDILSEKYIQNINRPAPFSAVLHAVPGIVRWLIRFFTLTEEDRLAAGIYVGGKGHDG
jgi:hypothetical protein